MAAFTIIVDASKAPVLTYTDDKGPGGKETGPKRHHIFKNCDVSWLCPQAPIFIQFTGTRKIFTNNVPGYLLSVTAPKNTKTPPLTTKNNSNVGAITKYFVSVATVPMAGEDPDLEDGGTGGGGSKKKAAKKAKAKKAKAKKVRR